MLITHPDAAKNRDLQSEFDKFADLYLEDKNIVPILYNGINESEMFKVPKKLPTFLYFKDQNAPIEIDRFSLMDKNKKFKDVMQEFVTKC